MLTTLFGQARAAVIGLLFSEPGTRLHVREIARQASLSAPTIARELASLRKGGFVQSEAIGNQVVYEANPAHPLAPELQAMAGKTWGVIGRVRRALSGRSDVAAAFIFGSYAAGADSAKSDLDVLVIGDAPFGAMSAVAASLSTALGRTVSIKLYRRDEWDRKRNDGNAFVASVLREPLILIAGGEETQHGKEAPGSHGGKGLDPAARTDARGGGGASSRSKRIPRRR